MGTSVQLGILTNSYPIFILLGLNGLTVSNAIGKHHQPVYIYIYYYFIFIFFIIFLYIYISTYIHTNCQINENESSKFFSKN